MFFPLKKKCPRDSGKYHGLSDQKTKGHRFEIKDNPREYKTPINGNLTLFEQIKPSKKLRDDYINTDIETGST